MLIYAQEITERLLYTLNFVFTEHGYLYRLTNDENEFLAEKGLKLNYSTYPFDDASFKTLQPSSFLFEEQYHKDTQQQVGQWNSVSCLEINHVVDPLAAVFYVLSRYEEYGDVARDIHGRFFAKNSVLVQNNWIKSQIVERWIWAFFEWLNPELLKQWDKTVTCIPSFDIDNTFAYKWKEGWRSWLSGAKDIVLKNRQRRVDRKEVQSANKKDPFDSFDEIIDVSRYYPETKIFWLLGDFGKFDKNIAWNDPRHQRLIRSLAETAEIGIHPSYRSNDYGGVLAKEIGRLAHIKGKSVSHSRQHFLRLRFPKTYAELIEQHISHDFTMGFAEEVGFRAGTARSFSFFNVETNTVHASLRIHPFCYMDGTLLEYKGWSIEEAKNEIRCLFQEIELFGGEFCFIWHNETFAEAGKWKGWREVANFSLKLYEAHLR